MVALFRPFVAATLCLVLALGQLPAWLHVAECESGRHQSTADQPLPSEGPDEACSCHGHCHTPSIAAESQSDQPCDDAPCHEHDADGCVVCQSLLAPFGVLWQATPAVSCDVLVAQCLSPVEAAAAAFSCAIPQPRGPPTAV